MKVVKYPLFAESLKRLIAQERLSGSAFSRKLNIHPCTVFEWTNGKRLPKKFLKEILREIYGTRVVFDDETADLSPR